MKFTQILLEQWVLANLKDGLYDLMDVGWEVKITTIVWWLWKWRNNRIFKKEEIPISIKWICLRSCGLNSNGPKIDQISSKLLQIYSLSCE